MSDLDDLIKGKNFNFSILWFFCELKYLDSKNAKKFILVKNFQGFILGRATEATLRRWISLEPMKILTRGLREVLKIDLLYILTNFHRNRWSSFREKWKKPIFWLVFKGVSILLLLYGVNYKVESIFSHAMKQSRCVYVYCTMIHCSTKYTPSQNFLLLFS